MVWHVSTTLKFNNCTWNQPVTITPQKNNLKSTQEADVGKKMVKFVHCHTLGSELNLQFKIARVSVWMLTFQECDVQNTAISSDVELKIENSHVDNAVIDITSSGSERREYGDTFPEFLFNNVTSFNTSVHATNIPRLKIDESKLKEFKAIISGDVQLNIETSHVMNAAIGITSSDTEHREEDTFPEFLCYRATLFNTSLHATNIPRMNVVHSELKEFKAIISGDVQLKIETSQVMNAAIDVTSLGSEHKEEANNFSQLLFNNVTLFSTSLHATNIPRMNVAHSELKEFKAIISGDVQLKIETSQVMNAAIDVTSLGSEHKEEANNFSQLLFNNVTLFSTSLHATNIPRLNLVDSMLKKFNAEVEDHSWGTTVKIENSHFEDISPYEGTYKENRTCIANQTNFFQLKQVAMEIIHSIFIMTCILPEGFIKWGPTDGKGLAELRVKNTIFDVAKISVNQPLISSPFGSEEIDMENVTLKCMTRAKHQLNGIIWDLKCVSTCVYGKYRSDGPAAVISMEKNKKGQLELKSKEERCLSCPVGADCNSEYPSPRPNYWGYRHKEGRIRMVRCPEKYCCSGSEHCQSLTSCAKGRTGTLCGRCKANTTESLFSPSCVSIRKCRTFLVVLFYVLAALGYALFLLLFNQMKKAVFQKLKDVWKMLKSRVSKKKSKDHFELAAMWRKELQKKVELIDSKKPAELLKIRKCRSLESLDLRVLQQKETTGYRTSNLQTEEKETAKEKESGGGMKYLQILFYFVQDAALFKVHLPEVNISEKSFLVTFLELSPQILFLYTEVTNLCLVSTTPAVLKVVLKTLFGPCIMLLLFVIYLAQLFLSTFFYKDSLIWETVKAKLCEAFLLTILFSYQKIVQGVFKLVQCIELPNSKVLFIQADILCFTWWQTAIEVYLSLATVPVFVFLALGPYFIKKKQMSTRMFLVACLFPLPVLLYFVVHKMVQKPRCLKSSNPSNGGTSVKISILNAGQVKDVEYTSTEEAILETLLKHYKTLNICGIHMTWLVFLKLYRMALVRCSTYITEPFPRLCVMTALVLIITIVTALVKPYKDNIANKVAFLSYIASHCIAFINMAKSALISGTYELTPLVKSVTTYLDLCDSILLSWLPLVALALWIFNSLWNLVRPKKEDAKK